MLEITAIETRVSPFSSGTSLDEDRISTPLSWYPRFAERRNSWRGPGSDLVWVLLRSGTDLVGIGQSRGGVVTETAIRSHLADLLLGRDGSRIEDLGRQLRRALTPYADGLFAAMAVSAVELALWDLNARAAGVPLFRLLGGHGDRLRHYLTIGSSDAIDHAEALFARTGGVDVVKVPMEFGPADGFRSLAANVARVAKLRNELPDHVDIAVDCFASWDLGYATRFARACDGLGLAWIEEPFAYDDVARHRRLRDSLAGSVRVATGEHLSGIRVAEQLITGGAVDVIQTDVTWCGGISIARTIAAIAAEHGVLFAPHASALQPWALHLLSACGPDALAEVLVLDSAATPPSPRASQEPGIGLSAEEAGFAS